MAGAREVIDGYLDQQYIIDTLVDLLKVPTDVPMGTATLMAPDDPKLVHYVQEVVRPKLQAIGAYGVIDVPLNQLVVQMGRGESGRSLLVMAYTPSQHSNLMADPWSGRIAMGTEHGFDEPCAFGQGATQNKSHMAAMLGVLKMLVDSDTELSGMLYFGVNNEGRSSHECSDAIIAALPAKPTFGIVLQRTGFQLQLGNRGRVDVNVTVRGKASHSSRPDLGQNAIQGANEAMARIAKLEFSKTHPQLGGQHAVPYQVAYSPLAPHTIPDTAYIRVDRRLLPGDDIDEAVEEVREAVGDLSPFEVTVERGVHMLPALVEPSDPGVVALTAAHAAVFGDPPEHYYHLGSYDAGGPNAHGVPTVQYGGNGANTLLGEDFVPLSGVVAEARVMATLVLDYLG